MNILIVEDNETVRQMLFKLVSPFAETVYQCGDGKAAVELNRQFHPEWILMNIELREMDGLTAMRSIIAESPETKILVVTNYDGKEMRQMSHEAGACGFIQKENLFDVRSFLSDQIH